MKFSSSIIFTTAYGKYALKAFKVNSIDYLLKPMEEGAYSKSLQKFRKLQQGQVRAAADFDQLLAAFKAIRSFLNRDSWLPLKIR